MKIPAPKCRPPFIMGEDIVYSPFEISGNRGFKGTKIWNSEQPDEDAVKVLCMLNNFTIDYAKTLYKPTIPKGWEKRIAAATKAKVPYFFQFAKGKAESQVAPRGTGVVDRLYNAVQIYKFKFNASALGHFDYTMLMYDKDVAYGDKERKLVDEFRKSSSRLCGQRTSAYDDDNLYWLKVKELRQRVLQYGSVQYVTDVLVRGLFHEHHVRKKSAFWDCFGNTVYENLLNNLPANTKLCLTCGKRIPIGSGARHCESCMPRADVPSVQFAECIVCGSRFVTKDYQSGAICPACQHMRSAKSRCVECGAMLEMRTRGRPSTRCPSCQNARNRAMAIQRAKKSRQK